MDQLVQVGGYLMESMLIDMAFAVLFGLIKQPSKVAKMKAALRKLRDALNKLPLDV